MFVAPSPLSFGRRFVRRMVAAMSARAHRTVRVTRTRARWRLRGPNRDEVLRLLRAHRRELAASPRQVLVRAEGEGVSHATVWRWVRRNGAVNLEVVLAARLGDAEMRRHLAGKTLPVQWAVEQLAAEAAEVEAGPEVGPQSA